MTVVAVASMNIAVGEEPSDAKQSMVPEAAELSSSRSSSSLSASEAEPRSQSSCEFCDLRGYIAQLEKHFGYKLLWLLFAVQFLLKGFASDLIRKAEPYIYKLYHVPAPRMQVYMGVSFLPWAMKPIIGLASDICPIGGYNKAPYMLLTSILGLASFLCVGLIPIGVLPAVGIVACFVFIQLQVSTGDLLSEAKYAEKMRQCPSQGPALMSYVWFGMQVGSLLAVLLSGLLISYLGPKALYVIAAFPAASVLLPLFMNFMEESALSREQVSEVRQRFYGQVETCVLCGLMLVGTFILTGFGLFASTQATTLVAILVATVMLLSFSVMLCPVIAKFNAFSLIQTSCTLSVSGAAFYFFTDTPEQYPEGPHFSPFFFNSVLGAVTSVCSLFGIFFYQRYMSSWKYRNILLATNVGYSIMCLPDILLFTRFNLKMGIPDHAFVLGSAVAQNIIMTWQWMPQVVILSFLCPKGMEATMYALLAGCHNLGGTIAANCGALMLEWLGCSPNGSIGESSKFERLWIGSAISTALPLITILALFLLIPDASQNEMLVDESEGSATAGSLWRSWTGQDTKDFSEAGTFHTSTGSFISNQEVDEEDEEESEDDESCGFTCGS